MTVKVLVANNGTDSVDFVNNAGTTLAQIKSTDGGSSNGSLALYTTSSGTSSEKVRVDKDGNVGIGTASPGQKLDVSGAIRSSGSTNPFFQLSDGTNNGYIQLTSNILNLYTGQSIPMTFSTAGSERMRIDPSGSLLVGTTTAGLPGILGASTLTVDAKNTNNGITIGNIPSGGYVALGTRPSGAFQYYAGYFANSSNTSVGNISCSTTATTYNTSSDYRLKHDIQPMTGALARVAALKPVTYKWNLDNSESEGFIAHELAEVCPHAVTGEKDAVDADGNPRYQGIDTSFLVATLTAAIQELSSKNNALEARLAALEAK